MTVPLPAPSNIRSCDANRGSDDSGLRTPLQVMAVRSGTRGREELPFGGASCRGRRLTGEGDCAA